MHDLRAGNCSIPSGVACARQPARDGKVRLLAAAGSKRIKLHPDVRSMAELGRPEVDLDLWFGVVAPAGTDPAIVRTLNAMLVKATNDPELAERWEKHKERREAAKEKAGAAKEKAAAKAGAAKEKAAAKAKEKGAAAKKKATKKVGEPAAKKAGEAMGQPEAK